MRILLSFIFLLSGPYLLFSQDLHIYYQVQNDSIWFVQNNRPVADAAVKKGQQVHVHIVDFNDYLYHVEIEESGTDYQIPQTETGSLFSAGGASGLASFKDILGQFGGPGFSIPDMPFQEKDREGFGTAENEESFSQELSDLSYAFENTLKSMQRKEVDLRDLEQDIELDIKSQELNAYLQEELRLLRFHPNLPPPKIKSLSLEYMRRILDVKPGQTYTLERLLDRARVENSIGDKVKSYKQQVEEIEQDFTNLRHFKELIVAIDAPATTTAFYQNTYGDAERRMEQYITQSDSMEAALPELSDWNIRELAAIRYLYEEMESHSFSRTYTFTPEQDIHTLHIKLVPTDSAQLQGVSPRALTPLRVPVYGGLKINASVGISFAGFFDRPQAYFSRDGRIVADDLDPFQPIITSFFHFYAQSRKAVCLGGTFGLGIGIGGEGAGLQNYFFGPSLILGKGQRMVLSSGIMTGKVDRLAEGYLIGDLYEQDIVPTKSVYELGYFLGISFNLMGQ